MRHDPIPLAYKKLRGLTSKAWSKRFGFLDGVKNHGKDDKIHSAVMAEKMGLTQENIRALTHYWRLQLEPICTTVDEGYWYGDTPGCIDKSLPHLEARVSSTQKVIDALRLARARLATGYVANRELFPEGGPND